MKFDIKARYPAPSTVVLKMFMDKEFHAKKLQVLGIQKSRVLEHSATGDDFRIKVERKVPLDAPGIVKKFIPAEATVTSEEKWNRAARSSTPSRSTPGCRWWAGRSRSSSPGTWSPSSPRRRRPPRRCSTLTGR